MTLEKFIEINRSVGHSFLTKALKCSEAVVRITVFFRESISLISTGLLINQAYVLTCSHAIGTAQAAANAKILFDYYLNDDGTLHMPEEFLLALENFFATDQRLDISVIAIDQNGRLASRFD